MGQFENGNEPVRPSFECGGIGGIIHAGSGDVTADEKSLLKHGLFWATLLAGFWLSITAIHKFWVTVAGMVVWWVFLYAVFYRYGHRGDSNRPTTPR